jgi:sugar lactone lactonase YvrE
MKAKLRTLTLTVVFSSLSSLPAEAVSTSIWRETDYTHFYQGEWQNISLTGRGELILGAATELVYDSRQLHIWSLIADGALGLIFVGTGNDGKIFKIDEDGGSLLYDSTEIAIHSLALNKDGHLFAGSSPRGIIYKLELDIPRVTVFADLEEEYIWALAFDSDGYLYVGTGREGRIYRISPQREVKLLFDSPESHILSLIVDEDDNLYASSKGQGIVYKIDREGKVFALYDPPQKEVRLLARDSHGNLFAGAIGEKVAPPAGHLPAPVTSFVYKITPEGDHREWFRLDGFLLSMLIDERDNLYLGTGNNGRLYKINREGEAMILLEVPEPQILSLARGKGDYLYLGTANPGRLHTFSSDYYAWEGTFKSQVYDASFISYWGNISSRGEAPQGTTITLATRSGNTAQPDVTWSRWSKEHPHPGREPVTSPPARFIQYQVRLSTQEQSLTPIVSEVSLAFRPRNQAPQITALKVVTPSEGGERGKITITWGATDPNGHALLYDLYFRGEEEGRWKELKEGVRETTYSRETLVFPDGIYFIKLRVSDSPDNPPPYALTDEKVSLPFLIDNTRPTVENLEATLSGKVATVRGKAVDNLSSIKRIDYSLNAGNWRPIHPLDGIFDSLSEPFEFTLSELATGEHTLILRVIDEAGNVGSASTVFLIEE